MQPIFSLPRNYLFMKKMDYDKIKRFWDKCPEISNEAPSLITTLSFEIPGHANYRDKTEKNILLKYLEIRPDFLVADLGCGTGRWAIEFARKCRKVIACDISKPLLDIAKAEAKQGAITNIEFQQESIVDFQSAEKADVIHIGGVLIYVNDTDLEQIIEKCHAMLKDSGALILRESISLDGDLLKEDLKLGNERYTAYYRTAGHLTSRMDKLFVLEKMTETHSYIFPVPIFIYLIPRFLKKMKITEYCMRMLYAAQWRLDPWLLRIKALTALKHKRLLKTKIPATQYFFIYRKRSQNVHS